jgi:hypothetical protein
MVTHNWYTAGAVIQNGRVVDAAPCLRRKILFLPAMAAIHILVSSGATVETVP